MKKLLIILLSCLALYGCQTAKPIIKDETKFIVITVPNTLLQCDTKVRIPNPDTLTNEQAVATIDQIYRKLKACGYNMDQVRNFLEEAKVKYDLDAN